MSFFSAAASEIRYISRLSTCGVCTAIRRSLSGVKRTFRFVSRYFTVLYSGAQAEAAPQESAALTTLSMSSLFINGRAQSWKQRKSLFAAFAPFLTDSVRVAPPSTVLIGFLQRDTMVSISLLLRQTRTMSSTVSAAETASSTRSSTVLPPRSMSGLLTPPIRVPLPAATITAETVGLFFIAVSEVERLCVQLAELGL